MSVTPTPMRGIGVLLGVAALCWMIAPTRAGADTVTDWNGYASTAIVANTAVVLWLALRPRGAAYHCRSPSASRCGRSGAGVPIAELAPTS